MIFYVARKSKFISRNWKYKIISKICHFCDTFHSRLPEWCQSWDERNKICEIYSFQFDRLVRWMRFFEWQSQALVLSHWFFHESRLTENCADFNLCDIPNAQHHLHNAISDVLSNDFNLDVSWMAAFAFLIHESQRISRAFTISKFNFFPPPDFQLITKSLWSIALWRIMLLHISPKLNLSVFHSIYLYFLFYHCTLSYDRERSIERYLEAISWITIGSIYWRFEHVHVPFPVYGEDA